MPGADAFCIRIDLPASVATAISNIPSPLRSSTATALTPGREAITAGGSNVPGFPGDCRNNEIPAGSLVVPTTRSGLPSASMSPTATSGDCPVGYSIEGRNLPGFPGSWKEDG